MYLLVTLVIQILKEMSSDDFLHILLEKFFCIFLKLVMQNWRIGEQSY